MMKEKQRLVLIRMKKMDVLIYDLTLDVFLIGSQGQSQWPEKTSVF